MVKSVPPITTTPPPTAGAPYVGAAIGCCQSTAPVVGVERVQVGRVTDRGAACDDSVGDRGRAR